MKRLACLLLALIFAAPVFAGPVEMTRSTPVPTEPVPSDEFNFGAGYVLGSDLIRDRGNANFGSQDAFDTNFEWAHRFQISGMMYFHLGVAYDRFDFGNTDAPVPVHLQSGAAVVGIDFMHGSDVGASLQFRPGFYTEEHLGISSFDCPITLFRIWVVQDEKFYVLTGANYSFLRGSFPIVPILGVVYIFNDHWRLMAVPPNPKLIYSVSKQLDLWIGGQILGGSFRTDHHDDYLGIKHVGKLSGAQVDYTDIRVGVGFTYSPTERIDIDVSGGYSIERSLNFHRAGESFDADPAPYVMAQVSAKF